MPSSRGFPDPGIETESPALAGGFFTTQLPGKPLFYAESNIYSPRCVCVGICLQAYVHLYVLTSLRAACLGLRSHCGPVVVALVLWSLSLGHK